MKIQVQETKFVPASHLFKGLRKLWIALGESDPDFTWGSNNRSLVTAECILNHLDNRAVVPTRQQDAFRKRCQQLPGGLQCYVDLEN